MECLLSSVDFQTKSKKLEVYSSKDRRQKEELKRGDPALFAEFEHVWNIRNSHMAHGLPP